MKIIIFTGPPASGKSSVAEFISHKKGIEVISKDNYKILLFEKYGFTNHDEKKELSILGEKQMYSEIINAVNNDIDIIVDNNFKNFDKIREILKDTTNKVTVLCICFTAEYSKLAERYNNRILSGNRHLALYTLNQYPVIDGISIFHPKITEEDVFRIEQGVKESKFGENILEIDTNNIEKDFYEICSKVIEYIDKIEV